MNRPPCSARETVGGMVYFARMLDKIRLHAEGALTPDYQPHLGTGSDGRCCAYLGVSYEALRERVLHGGTDEEILGWCFENGRRLSELEILVWNGFASKRGWRDDEKTAATLRKFKDEAGLGNRSDVVTFFDFFDADEGRTV